MLRKYEEQKHKRGEINTANRMKHLNFERDHGYRNKEKKLESRNRKLKHKTNSKN